MIPKNYEILTAEVSLFLFRLIFQTEGTYLCIRISRIQGVKPQALSCGKKYLQFNLKTKMKNLDLNNYGVQELNAGEMQTTEGGFLGILALLIVVAIIKYAEEK